MRCGRRSVAGECSPERVSRENGASTRRAAVHRAERRTLRPIGRGTCAAHNVTLHVTPARHSATSLRHARRDTERRVCAAQDIAQDVTPAGAHGPAPSVEGAVRFIGGRAAGQLSCRAPVRSRVGWNAGWVVRLDRTCALTAAEVDRVKVGTRNVLLVSRTRLTGLSRCWDAGCAASVMSEVSGTAGLGAGMGVPCVRVDGNVLAPSWMDVRSMAEQDE